MTKNPVVYGALLHESLFKATMTDVVSTAKQFADGYHDGFRGRRCTSGTEPVAHAPVASPVVTIAVGTSNDDTDGSVNTALNGDHARSWAAAVNTVKMYAANRGYTEIAIAASIDAEPCFIPGQCTPDQLPSPSNYGRTAEWVSSYSFTDVSNVYNYGSIDGHPCRPGDDGRLPKNNCSKWSADQLFMLAWGVLRAVPLPEIYGVEESKRWYLVDRWGIDAYGSRMNFFGAMSHRSSNDPPSATYSAAQSWQSLWLMLNGDPQTAQMLPASTDICYIRVSSVSCYR